MKVEVIRKVGLASGVVLAGTSSLACSAAPADTGSTSASNLIADATNPGTGTFLLSSYDQSYESTSGGDEYVRTGEALTFSLQFNDVWESLYPNDYDCMTCPTQDNLDQVQVTVNLWFKKNGQDAGSIALPITWSAVQYNWTGATAATIVPTGVDLFYISYTAIDTKTGTTHTTQYSGNNDIPVYGGDLPDKNVIFDTNGSQLRQRTIEGGALVQGADVTIVYSDYRADTIVDRTNLNTSIGTQTNYSRFGTSTVALLGTVQYDVSAAISYDDGANWTSLSLNEVPNSDQILPKLQYGTGRVGYENKVQVPEGSNGIKIAFHVQAYMIADYSDAYDVASKSYSQGQRIDLADVWDNNGSSNYSIVVGQ